MHSYKKFVNPHLGELLEKINLDKEFTSGKGCYLYDSNNQKYLDCIANYGALPFGHNFQPLWQTVTDFKKKQEPNLAKPSLMKTAGKLAEQLISITPKNLKYVTFANSGAETVEAAIKISRSATGRKGILSTHNSFHGKTLGALSATGNRYYQKVFQTPVTGFEHIEYGNPEALKNKLEEKPDYFAAFIVEPIQGEGGIITPPQDYLKKAAQICRQYNVAFILDEIQTGLGRTGSLFAMEQFNVKPDMLLLAKALGGGLVSLGACLSSKEFYNKKFADRHSSTFAGNNLACIIGLKVIRLLLNDNQKIVKKVNKKGQLLKNRLQNIAEKFPEVIRSVRGKGFMLGLEFGIDRKNFPDSLLGIMAEQELLTPLVSGYLLNNERLRVAPTLNGNRVIRIEPPLVFTKKQCIQTTEKIQKMVSLLDGGNTARFISYLIEKTPDDFPSVSRTKNKAKLIPGKKEGKFAFLIHPLNVQNYYEYDSSLKAFSEDKLSQLTRRWNELVEPFVLSRTRIKSRNGQTAYGEFIAIPRTTRELLDMNRQEALSEVKKGLELARKNGAKITGLGAYTSVVTMAGLYVKKEEMPVTTGNSYTVVASVKAINKALDKLNIDIKNCTVAVVGATGSIGGGAARLISRSSSKLILIGNPDNKESSIKRLQKVKLEIKNYLAELCEQNQKIAPKTIGHKLKNHNTACEPITITTELKKGLSEADVIICATNTIKKLITPKIVKKGAIICDISRPKNVTAEITQKRPDVLVIDGGVIKVPGRPSMGWNFGFDKGLVYACMAETMMLALEKNYQNHSIGSSGVNLDSILYTEKLAQKHGFTVSQLRSFDRPLSSQKWQQVASFHQKHRNNHPGNPTSVMS